MKNISTRHRLHPQPTARNVAIWLIKYYRITRGNELSVYWGLPYWVDNYEAIHMWVKKLKQQQRPARRTLGDVRRMFEEQLPI